MRSELLQLAADLAQKEEPFVLAVVVRRLPASSAARHSAEHAGRTWYFCCGGCRERFLAAPERYMAAEGPA